MNHGSYYVHMHAQLSHMHIHMHAHATMNMHWVTSLACMHLSDHFMK